MERHRLDPISLVAGVLFAGLGVAALTGAFDIALVDWRYIGPLLVILVGMALALTAPLSRPHDTDDHAQDGSTEPERVDADPTHGSDAATRS
jgi:membrane protein implicated in regulation of membrane protease activity